MKIPHFNTTKEKILSLYSDAISFLSDKGLSVQYAPKEELFYINGNGITYEKTLKEIKALDKELKKDRKGNLKKIN
jgi:hypothetical protein